MLSNEYFAIHADWEGHGFIAIDHLVIISHDKKKRKMLLITHD
jgi:hypothetical protein